MDDVVIEAAGSPSALHDAIPHRFPPPDAEQAFHVAEDRGSEAVKVAVEVQ